LSQGLSHGSGQGLKQSSRTGSGLGLEQGLGFGQGGKGSGQGIESGQRLGQRLGEGPRQVSGLGTGQHLGANSLEYSAEDVVGWRQLDAVFGVGDAYAPLVVFKRPAYTGGHI
jgi:hypothetical protein